MKWNTDGADNADARGSVRTSRILKPKNSGLHMSKQSTKSIFPDVDYYLCVIYLLNI